MAMEKAERMEQMVTMVLHSDRASTSGVALSTQTMTAVRECVGVCGVDGVLRGRRIDR